MGDIIRMFDIILIIKCRVQQKTITLVIVASPLSTECTNKDKCEKHNSSTHVQLKIDS
jgi:hypothetical protein